MSLNSLKIATAGYLKRGTKAALVIAVAGYLNFNDVPPAPYAPTFDIEHKGGSAGKEDELRKRILREDEEMLTFIEFFLRINDG